MRLPWTNECASAGPAKIQEEIPGTCFPPCKKQTPDREDRVPPLQKIKMAAESGGHQDFWNSYGFFGVVVEVAGGRVTAAPGRPGVVAPAAGLGAVGTDTGDSVL